MNIKKKMTIIAVTVISTLLLSACGQKPVTKADDFVLKVGYSGSLCEAPVHMAVEKGFFAEEGLKVDLIKLAPGTTFEAITAGKIDAAFGLLASLMQPLSNGLPIKVTTGLHTGCDKVLVPSNTGIKTLADLKGKRIGVPSMTSSPIIFAKRALADAGVGVSEKNMEVEFAVYNASDLPIALKNGAVDALAMNDPTAAVAQKEFALVTLVDSAVTEPYNKQYCCSAYVHDNIAKDHPEIAAKYTRAMQKASAWIQKNQDETAKIQVEKKWVAGDAAFNATVLKTYNYIPSVKGAYDAFGITAKQLQNVGMLNGSVDVEALHKNSFVFFKDVQDTVQ
ncbi:ABC transporter substrate-binding protein [Sporomusa sp.]|jgi:NitT/TauT family transport system substrate-binding protein|uniref:ABC transporter substrate-binding protein n=1 Tax=Sporomusa sp. TaxID=2078658 RepID=UPI002C390A45|nr:ABC transporter substrate-binding protein [Sporomusa sp.]MDF2873895.1 transporter, substrate-binding protein aliphatic sulfonates family [Sporomusa sp.]HWR08593.1 ABC transporter substrate-binding protein [Sporomusa sp.]